MLNLFMVNTPLNGLVERTKTRQDNLRNTTLKGKMLKGRKDWEIEVMKDFYDRGGVPKYFTTFMTKMMMWTVRHRSFEHVPGSVGFV